MKFQKTLQFFGTKTLRSMAQAGSIKRGQWINVDGAKGMYIGYYPESELVIVNWHNGHSVERMAWRTKCLTIQYNVRMAQRLHNNAA